MKKIVILILIIFSIINCQSDDDKLNINDKKVSNKDITLKTFNLKLDKNYFLVNKEIKFKINYELENKKDNKNLVLRIKSVGEDALKHQINGADFIFGKKDVKEKQYFFDNVNNQMYLTPKKTGYLDIQFSGQLYDTVKKEYVSKPIISEISLVSLKIDLSVSHYTSFTDFYVQFDDGILETDNFLSTKSDIVESFELTVVVDDKEIETTKNINLYETTKIFENKTGNVPKKIDIILKQRLTNGDINTFKFNDLEFDFKKIKLKSFDLKLDKNYLLVTKKIKIKVNYEIENKDVNKNLVLRIRSIGKDITKHQINGVDFIFGKTDVNKRQDFFDNIDDYMYLRAKRTGNLDLEFSGQLYDTVKKQYVGEPVISKISLVSLKIRMVLVEKVILFSPIISNIITITFSDGDFESDNFLSTKPSIVDSFDVTIVIDDGKIKSATNINPYLETTVYKSKPTTSKISKIDVVLLKKMTNGKVNKFTFKNVEFITIKKP